MKSKKSFHFLMYVEDSSPKIKRFNTKDQMHKFVNEFQSKYPDHMTLDSGYWIDFCVFDVHGDIHFFTDGIEVK